MIRVKTVPGLLVVCAGFACPMQTASAVRCLCHRGGHAGEHPARLDHGGDARGEHR